MLRNVRPYRLISVELHHIMLTCKLGLTSLNLSTKSKSWDHRRTGRCGVLAIATWAALFRAAQGRLLTKKEERKWGKGEKKKERKKEKEKKMERREEREDLRPIWAGYSVFRL